jgi:hypothetical protein
VKKTLLFVLVAVAAFAANSLVTSGIPVQTHPQPPVEYEFYWDDGILSSGWVWYTGGNYWGVQFDEVKTGGDDTAGVTNMGCVTYVGWPDGTFQGCYLHTFSDLGGYPGTDLGDEWLMPTIGNQFEWVATGIGLDTPVFYVAYQQYGNYPSTDGIGVDAVAGTHDWTGYQGSWAPTTLFGDFMIRCYWDEWPDPGVSETSWGAVKVLY